MNFLSVMPAWLLNICTVLGAIMGIALSTYAIFFSITSNQKNSKLSESIANNTSAIDKQSREIQKQTRILRLDNLRFLAEQSKEDELKSYWRFRWRFETFDNFIIPVFINEQGDCVSLEVKVLGYSNPQSHLGLENLESCFYIVEVVALSGSEIKPPFSAGDLLACFHSNGKLFISEGLDGFTRFKKFEFEIGGLGREIFSSGERIARLAKFYPRIKDS